MVIVRSCSEHKQVIHHDQPIMLWDAPIIIIDLKNQVWCNCDILVGFIYN